MNLKKPFIAIIVSSVVLGACTNAAAWHAGGHVKATELSLMLLRDKMPEFFLAGGPTIAHCCCDPDLFSSIRTPQLSRSEKPEHYIDWDLLDNRPLPKSRYAFLDLCRELEKKPWDIGMLPYSVAEWTQRLTIALAEHRRWPQDRHIQMKCLVFAGILAHYAGDASQPLHLTVHHDGRADASGKSPHSGIHQKVDALLGKLQAEDEDLLQGLTVSSHRDTMSFLLEQIEKNREVIDTVYKLETRLPDVKQSLGNDPELIAFVSNRMRSASKIIACIFLSAWENSASVELPKWHKRNTLEPVHAE